MNRTRLLLNIFLFVFAGVMIFEAFAPIYNSLALRCDSMESPWELQTNFFGFFSASDHCWYIMSMFWSMSVRFIPELLKIHPQAWAASFYPWILFAIMYLLQISILENFTKYFNKNYFKILYIFLLFPIFCGILHSSNATWIVSDDCWSFAYLFLPVFSIVLFAEIEKIYVKNDEINKYIQSDKKNIFHICILLFLLLCVSISHEFSRFVLCSMLFLVYIFHILFINKNINHKKFWYIYISVVIINTLLFYVPNYQSWLNKRLYSLSEIINLLPIYLKGYCSNILLNNTVLLLEIAGLIIITYIFAKKEQEHKRIISYAIAISLSVLIFPLIIMIGHQNGQFSFAHEGIKFMTKLYLYNVILSLCGWLISNLKNNKLKFYTVSLCFMIMILFIKPIIYTDNYIIEYNKKIRTRTYILERIFDLYGRQNKIYVWGFDKNMCLLSAPAHLIYFKYLYDKETDFNDYKSLVLCSEDADFEQCNNKLIKFLEDKTGYKLTTTEVEKQDFQKYYRY